MFAGGSADEEVQVDERTPLHVQIDAQVHESDTNSQLADDEEHVSKPAPSSNVV